MTTERIAKIRERQFSEPHIRECLDEIERLRGIIARNARTRLSGDEGPLFVTADDIKNSMEILYAEQALAALEETK